MFYGPRSLVLALATCLTLLCCQLPQQLVAQSAESTEKLIKQLKQPIVSGRVDAAKKLASMGAAASDASSALIDCLSDNNADVRLAAAYSLACVQSDATAALEALVPLLADSDEHVRYSVQWSIARIGQALSPELTIEQVTKLSSVLTAAVREISRRDHQPRHLIATEIALSRVNQLLARHSAPPIPPAPEPPVESPDPQIQKDAGENMATEIATSTYAASDLLGRFQFIDRLSILDEAPDTLRWIVIETECSQPEDWLLRYAMHSWGDRGQQLVNTWVDQQSDLGPIDVRYASLIALLKPAHEADQARLLTLALDAKQSFEVRVAAFDALSTSVSLDQRVLGAWMRLIANPQEDVALRCAAAESLGAAGRSAAPAESLLIANLNGTRDESLMVALAHALVQVAPASRVAFSAVHSKLMETPVDNVAFGDLLDACGEFGGLASDCVPLLIQGLTNKKADSWLRVRIADALAKIGPGARLAAGPLVTCIQADDEEMEVKNAAANALRAMDSAGADALIAGLDRLVKQLEIIEQPGQPSSLSRLVGSIEGQFDAATVRRSMTSVLRAMAICGSNTNQACPMAMRILEDEKNTLDLRCAAAAALAAMGREAHSASPLLQRMCADKEPTELRSASLLALASVAGSDAEPFIESMADESSVLLQASAAFANHLRGETKQAFDSLISLLDDSDTDEVITRTIADLGDAAQPWLYAVACDTNAFSAERMGCVRLICESSQPDWPRLLPLLDDFDIADRFTDLAEAWFDREGPAVSSLLRMIREGQLSRSAQARATRLLAPDGLGDGGDASEWQAWTLQRSSSLEKLTAGGEMASPEAMPEANIDTFENSSAPTASVPRKAIPPKINAPARAAAEEPINVSTPRLVEVFYGTNRARAADDRSQQELTVSVLATAGGGLLAMLLCLIGFVRSGNRFFAFVALICIGIAAPFGFYAAQEYAGASLTAPIKYSGVYSDAIELGVCQVSIPPGHKPGELESPNLFRLELKADVDKHVVLTNVEQLSKDKFFDSLQDMMVSKGKNILVFIHGYNVSFEDAARRTAQMAADLEFPGAPVFYSWPSQANWYGYATDKENIELSVTQIKHFLLDLAKQSGADSINLVAHSMGNVGLTEALKEMEQASATPLFNQVVLAAPDIDADIFKSRVAPSIVGKAQHVTLYTSQTDLALMASRYFNNGPRIGDSGAGVPLFPGIDTIDATSVDSSLLGHSYYGSNVSVLTDLGRVLANQPVSAREYLQAIAEAAQTYWTFDPARISQSQNRNPTR